MSVHVPLKRLKFGKANTVKLVYKKSTRTAGNRPPLMDGQTEIALALRPGRVASKVAVYVLDTTGSAKVRDSQSDFIAIV